MEKIKKMGQRYRHWYIMLLGIVGCLLLVNGTTPLFAGEVQSKKRALLAEQARLMYGLRGGKVQGYKSRRSTISPPSHPKVQTRTIKNKKRAFVGKKRAAKKVTHVSKKRAAKKVTRVSKKRAAKKVTRVSKKYAGKTIAYAVPPRRRTVERPSTTLKAKRRPRSSSDTQMVRTKKRADGRQKYLVRLRHSKSSVTKNVTKRRHETKHLFTTSAERRPGMFIKPVTVSGRSRSSGLFFRVAENANVKATARGQVVYAGWFRGYGLLTILNHGDRIYSLYGHNRVLLVAKGAFVKPGQIIAKSGKTGSVDGVPGLYFEIRKGNKPENPRRWLVRDERDNSKMASLLK